METFTTQIPRELASQYGQQAVRIIQQGACRAPSGHTVSIADLVERNTQCTVSYPPDQPLPQTHSGPSAPPSVATTAPRSSTIRKRLVNAPCQHPASCSLSSGVPLRAARVAHA